MGRAAAEVTVVIPTRNRLGFLCEAVDSVLSQRGVRVQLVVVDDASDDGTAGWLAARVDSRVRHVRLDASRERTVARNVGLAEATTPYVLFLDDDDLLAPKAACRLARALERHPAAPVAVGTYATFGTFGPQEVPRRQPIGRFPVCRQMWREILWGWYQLPGAALWRTKVLRDLGGWDEARTFAEDLELSLRVHPRAVALVPHVVLRYRQHGRVVDSLTETRRQAMNAEVREAFVAGLSAAEQRAARKVIDTRPVFERALAAYASGEYDVAARGLASGLIAVPRLALSPVLGPTLTSMLVKSFVAQVTPPSFQERVRRTRTARRNARFGSGAL